MQSLEIISVNLWNTLLSLGNLVLIFWIVKKFLFQPVRRVFEQRRNEIAQQYAQANAAEQQARANREAWETKLAGADAEADRIIAEATDTARHRATQIVEDANAKANGITKRAEEEAVLTKKKAEEGIKREIVDISSAIAEKMLEREIKTEDHRALIDSFIDKIGEENGGDQ